MHDHNTPTQESYTSKCTLMQSQMIMRSHNTPTQESCVIPDAHFWTNNTTNKTLPRAKISLGRDRPEPPTSGQLHPAEEIFIDQPSAPPLECGIPRSPETYPLTLLIAAPTEATAPTGAFITMRVAA